MAGADIPAKRSDLRVRVISAVMMIVVAGLALLLGGWIWVGFVVAVVLGILAEWTQLVARFEPRLPMRVLWLLAGLCYLGLAGYCALVWLTPVGRFWPLLVVVLSVIGVDVGAYFAGRTFGGPKIAPKISPSKTWAGLAGGIVGTWIVFALTCLYYRDFLTSLFDLQAANIGRPAALHLMYGNIARLAGYGVLTAVVAQAGDFLESAMKRRAGVKDSGSIIPGHGGLFDRADGMVAVLFALGVASLVWSMGQ
ncbi:phosphatidate cytidylyltransferase [Novosphingobium sp.]|uniref:phosphatidate cytidylyltransferase n=1 Tax=Novosphingobium sp. TaxID=1874826 RepID=UPI003B52A452